MFNYAQMKTYFNLQHNRYTYHASQIIKAVCTINGEIKIVEMCPECFKAGHDKIQQDVGQFYPDIKYWSNQTLDCKNTFYEIDEEGKARNVGQCCCYCSKHGVRSK